MIPTIFSVIGCSILATALTTLIEWYLIYRTEEYKELKQELDDEEKQCKSQSCCCCCCWITKLCVTQTHILITYSHTRINFILTQTHISVTPSHSHPHPHPHPHTLPHSLTHSLTHSHSGKGKEEKDEKELGKGETVGEVDPGAQDQDFYDVLQEHDCRRYHHVPHLLLPVSHL